MNRDRRWVLTLWTLHTLYEKKYLIKINGSKSYVHAYSNNTLIRTHTLIYTHIDMGTYTYMRVEWQRNSPFDVDVYKEDVSISWELLLQTPMASWLPALWAVDSMVPGSNLAGRHPSQPLGRFPFGLNYLQFWRNIRNMANKQDTHRLRTTDYNVLRSITWPTMSASRADLSGDQLNE